MNVASNKVLMVLDTQQVLKRIPRQYFRDPDGPAEAIFDGMFGPRPPEESLSALAKEILIKENIKLKFVKSSELTDAHIAKAKVIIVNDTLEKDVFKRVRAKQRKVLFLYESKLMDPKAHSQKYQAKFSDVLTYVDGENPHPRIHKYHYAVRDELKILPAPFNSRKFCCMIASGKMSYLDEALSLRQSFIQFFADSHPDLFDLWGSGWQQHEAFGNSSIVKGLADNKDRTMQHYKFVFCPENTLQVPGYITEKIWHAFRNGVIPIYLGPSNIDEYIPSHCYIDLRDFMADGNLDGQKLYERLENFTEKEYFEYMERIRIFLNSDSAKQFSPEAFASDFAVAIITAAKSPSSEHQRSPLGGMFSFSLMQRTR